MQKDFMAEIQEYKHDPMIFNTPNGLYVGDYTVYAANTINAIRVEKLLEEFETPFHKVQFWQTAYMGVMLVMNGVVRMCGADQFTHDEMLVHVAMQSHPNPKRVLIAGAGDGGAVREVLKYPSVEHVLWVDIDREVVEACQRHYVELQPDYDARVLVMYEDALALPHLIGHEQFDIAIWDLDNNVNTSLDPYLQNPYVVPAKLLREGGICAANMPPCWPDNYSWSRKIKKIQTAFRHNSLIWTRIESWYNTGEIMLMSNEDYPKNFRLRRNPFLPTGLRWYTEEYHWACQIRPLEHDAAFAFIPYV